MMDEDELLVIGKETDEKYHVTMVDENEIVEDDELIYTYILLQDKNDPDVKFTVRVSNLTAEYDIVGGWEEDCKKE
jgi:hypothetical protein